MTGDEGLPNANEKNKRMGDGGGGEEVANL